MTTSHQVCGSAPTPQDDEQTRALITALASVNGHIPLVMAKLIKDELPRAKQREFAELLISLGELLSEHAGSRVETRPDRQ
ncbi:MAG TPA: hypothetical protein VJT49_27390 [Amycolatopsis sp.]|uniref:hypothetical protein n=1 Tax=Amycolatopsis sp. TaxID=37632 RepID=UPI002B45C80F|nr:hypothetical protein [Amycolatopsis sp.]HKS48766.1 hypothetical protein [Amycolatopsis sp.]